MAGSSSTDSCCPNLGSDLSVGMLFTDLVGVPNFEADFSLDGVCVGCVQLKQSGFRNDLNHGADDFIGLNLGIAGPSRESVVSLERSGCLRCVGANGHQIEKSFPGQVWSML